MTPIDRSSAYVVTVTTHNAPAPRPGATARFGSVVERTRAWIRNRLLWKVWERMLETEFVDRSVALAGKAFISFFPLVIVVAAFLPPELRTSIFTTLTHRLGLQGHALALTRQAFTSADDVRQATGILGLVLTVFFSSSFTTALQRVYLRAWRRPRDLKVGSYSRGVTWLLAMLAYLIAVGSLARALGSGLTLIVFIPALAAFTVAWWWFTAWYLLLGHVRWRVLLPGAVITSVAMLGFAMSASVWMPRTVSSNLHQFGIFGIALALVTWFSGASVCLIVGACAGPVLAEDTGLLGGWTRGRSAEVLVPDAPPSVEPLVHGTRLRDVFGNRPQDIDED